MINTEITFHPCLNHEYDFLKKKIDKNNNPSKTRLVSNKKEFFAVFLVLTRYYFLSVYRKTKFDK